MAYKDLTKLENHIVLDPNSSVSATQFTNRVVEVPVDPFVPEVKRNAEGEPYLVYDYALEKKFRDSISQLEQLLANPVIRRKLKEKMLMIDWEEVQKALKGF